jgi:hypothetical protein
MNAFRTAAILATTAVAVTAAAGTASAASPTIPNVAFTNLALTQQLTLRPGGAATSAQPFDAAAHWDLSYVDSVPTEPGFSSPYQLRNRATGQCLEDVGEHRTVVAADCDAAPVDGSPQLWQHHRVVDRNVAGRMYYYRVNRSSHRVLTAQADQADGAPVRSLAAEPVSRSGAADPQLWVLLGA